VALVALAEVFPAEALVALAVGVPGDGNAAQVNPKKFIPESYHWKFAKSLPGNFLCCYLQTSCLVEVRTMKKYQLSEIEQTVIPQLQEAWGDKLLSVIAHGDCIRPEIGRQAHDSVQLALILQNNTLPVLKQGYELVPKFKKSNIEFTWFLTPDYIQETLDVFPLDYLNIQTAYKILFGEDLLKDLLFEVADLRLQCERELRGLMLHLRREILTNSDKPKALLQLLKISLQNFLPVFRGVCQLTRNELILSDSEVLQALIEDLNLSSRPEDLAGEPAKEAIEAVFTTWVSDLETIIARIDKWNHVK
jgi:hypothetical protein